MKKREVIILKIADAWQLVLDGKVRDAKTIAGVGLLYGQQAKQNS